MRRATLALATAVLLAAPTALAFFSGGYFGEPRLIAAIGACVLVLVAAVVSPAPLPRSLGRPARAGRPRAAHRWSPGCRSRGRRSPRARSATSSALLLYLAALTAAAALLRGRERAADGRARARGGRAAS